MVTLGKNGGLRAQNINWNCGRVRNAIRSTMRKEVATDRVLNCVPLSAFASYLEGRRRPRLHEGGRALAVA
jgi:hypothetical protein